MKGTGNSTFFFAKYLCENYDYGNNNIKKKII